MARSQLQGGKGCAWGLLEEEPKLPPTAAGGLILFFRAKGILIKGEGQRTLCKANHKWKALTVQLPPKEPRPTKYSVIFLNSTTLPKSIISAEFKAVMLQKAFCEHRESLAQGGYSLHGGKVKGSLTNLSQYTPVSTAYSHHGDHSSVGTEEMATAATG